MTDVVVFGLGYVFTVCVCVCVCVCLSISPPPPAKLLKAAVFQTLSEGKTEATQRVRGGGLGSCLRKRLP